MTTYDMMKTAKSNLSVNLEELDSQCRSLSSAALPSWHPVHCDPKCQTVWPY